MDQVKNAIPTAILTTVSGKMANARARVLIDILAERPTLVIGKAAKSTAPWNTTIQQKS